MQDLGILYEDGGILVVDKPTGLVVNESATADQTLQGWFAKRIGIGEGEGEFFAKQGVVHRLDKDTSGVMVLAKTEMAYEALKKQFLERRVKKKYLALVHGLMGGEGIISEPVERNPKNKMKFAVGKDLSRMAVTQWRVNEKHSHFTLLELSPLTGRTHQIRVHLKHVGHPIVADPIYGGKRYREDIKWCPRLFLHAFELEFELPGSGGKTVAFTAQLPADLKLALENATLV